MSMKRRLSSINDGFSLLEVLLVVAVMVLVAALALPALNRSFTVQSVKKGADRVRGEMSRARVRAMREDQIYAFFYSPGTSHFLVAPFSEAVPTADVGPVPDAMRVSHYDFSNNLLPQGVFFAGGDVAADARSQDAIEQAPGSISDMKPILFYPDGTAQDAVLLVQNLEGDLVEITVRGLTGITRSRTITDPNEIQQVGQVR